jgi:hypothetical protein
VNPDKTPREPMLMVTQGHAMAWPHSKDLSHRGWI